ncbi:MAG: hypothetical protein NT027_03880 [Proteobacteria bacterium]|nr:hypothetical protein [Pseudomonadota bacterium]
MKANLYVFVSVALMSILTGCGKKEASTSNLASVKGSYWAGRDSYSKDVAAITYATLQDMYAVGNPNVHPTEQTEYSERGFQLNSVEGFRIECAYESIDLNFPQRKSLNCRFSDGAATCGSCGPGLGLFIHTARADWGFNNALASRLNLDPRRTQSVNQTGVVTVLTDRDANGDVLVCARSTLTGLRSCAVGRNRDYIRVGEAARAAAVNGR